MENQSKNQNRVNISINNIDLFKSDLKSEKLQKTFKDIYESNNGNWVAIKLQLTADKSFTPELIRNLEFTNTLSVWGNNNSKLVELFKSNSEITSTRDIALKLNKAAFTEKVQNTVPDGTSEEKNEFTLNLYNSLFHVEPTAMLVNMIKDPQVPMLNDGIGANVASILEKQTEFNIKTTSIYEILNNEEVFKDIPADSKDTVSTQLKTLQRITAISPVPDTVPLLYSAKLHTALQISELPQSQFIVMMQNKGVDDVTLMNLHTNAQQARVRNEHALMALKETVQGTGVAMIDKSLNITTTEALRTESYTNTIETGSFEGIEIFKRITFPGTCFLVMPTCANAANVPRCTVLHHTT